MIPLHGQIAALQGEIEDWEKAEHALGQRGLGPVGRGRLENLRAALATLNEHAELKLRARAVVEARYCEDADWDRLKEAIASLGDLVGGGELI